MDDLKPFKLPSDWFKCVYVENKRIYYYEHRDPIALDYLGNLVAPDFIKTKREWDTLFEAGSGQIIDSYEKMKRIEKEKNMVYLSPQEAEHYSDKYNYRKTKEYNEAFDKRLFNRLDTTLTQKYGPSWHK